MRKLSISLVPFSFAGYFGLEFHRKLLEDSVRTNAFREAIFKVVKKGDVVIDLGAGTGILSFFASLAGAKRIYAIESAGVIEIAKQIAKDNKMNSKIVFLNKNSRLVHIPDKVDVIVSECIGYYVFGGDMVSAVADMRDKFLKEEGSIIPSHISMYLVPVESFLHHKYINYWNNNLYGIRFSLVQKMASNSVYLTTFNKESLICPPINIYNINLSRDFPNEMMNIKVDFLISQSRYMHGLCGWFDVELCKGVNFSTSPYNKTTVWKQIFFPLGEEILIKEGSVVRVNLILRRVNDDSCSCFDWNIEVTGSKGEKRRIVKKQSTKISLTFGRRGNCKKKICDINNDGKERNAELTKICKQNYIKKMVNLVKSTLPKR